MSRATEELFARVADQQDHIQDLELHVEEYYRLVAYVNAFAPAILDAFEQVMEDNDGHQGTADRPAPDAGTAGPGGETRGLDGPDDRGGAGEAARCGVDGCERAVRTDSGFLFCPTHTAELIAASYQR